MHAHVLHNGEIRPSHENFLTSGQVGLLNGWGVFSTIRVFDGVLFAWERHWDRMKRDAALLCVPFPTDRDQLEADLLRLIEANGAQNATLRVCIVRNTGGAWEGPAIELAYDVIAFTAVLTEWRQGAKLSVEPQARHSACAFAGTKILSWSMNLAWLEKARTTGFDEVVLLNERGEVSECTSANIFAAKGTEVWTPPLASGCLPGVTRELLLNAIPIEGWVVREKTLHLQDLLAADAVFITSTTRELLGVSQIAGVPVGQDKAARLALQSAFSNYVDQYVKAHCQQKPATLAR
jgi:branched-chain amino acid aminotransferase